MVEETPKKNESNGNQDNDEEELKSRSDLYKAKDVLGLYKVFPADINVKSEDAIDDSSAGGIICVGRGAYKEYLSGVHEGLLGPLEKPQSVIDEETKLAEEKEKEKEENPDKDDDNDEEQSNLKPVPLRYINRKIMQCPTSPRARFINGCKDDKGCLYSLNNQCTFPLPNLVGFTNIPRKIYRYFTKRFLVDDFGERTATIVNNKSRPFVYKDVLMAKEEEMDWPKSG